MARKPWYSGPWKRVRLSILERDGYLCTIRAAGCTKTATEVDHILPAALDPTGHGWYDPENLRASCRSCNLGRLVKATTTSSRQW
jgi:5-methylcytosine-specific restriction endonuclease McrA